MKRLLVVLLIMSILAMPVNAQEEGVIWVGGAFTIEAQSSFMFNWSWWGLEYGNWLSFYYTSNDPTTPINLTVWHEGTLLFQVYDYHYERLWNKSLGQFPESNQLWWFKYENLASQEVEVHTGLYYNITSPTGNPKGYALVTASFIMGTGLLLLIAGEIFVRRRTYTKRELRG